MDTAELARQLRSTARRASVARKAANLSAARERGAQEAEASYNVGFWREAGEDSGSCEGSNPYSVDDPRYNAYVAGWRSIVG